MSQIDDWLGPYGNNVNLIEGTIEGTVNFSPEDPLPSVIQGSIDADKDKAQFKELMDYINKILNTEIGQVTNRSDIINPDYILAKYNWTNSAEHISLYNRLRSILVNYQNQQQASYDDWYNSTTQQALRDQAAGLNTDLLGVSGSNTAGTATNDSQPFAGVPTSDEISIQKAQLRNQKFATLIQSVGTVANLASVFSGLSTLPLQKGLLAAQTAATSAQADLSGMQSESLNLSNISSFENLVGNEISSRLSDAITSSLSSGSSFDINDWFSNDSNFDNIYESYAPSDNYLYRNSFDNARKRLQTNLAKAYQQGKVTKENQGSLASFLANPYYSNDLKIQVAQMRPLMAAQAELEKMRIELEKEVTDWNTKFQKGLDVRSAVDVANARNDAEGDYWSELDMELKAKFENFQRQSDLIGMRLKTNIQQNYLDIYNNDPFSDLGMTAAYLYGGSAAQSFADFFNASRVEMYNTMVTNQNTILENQATFSAFKEKMSALSPIISLGTDNAVWAKRTKAGWQVYLDDVNKYLKTLNGIKF